MILAAVDEGVDVAFEEQREEGEIVAPSSQGTAEPSSQRFVAPTLPRVAGNDDVDMGGSEAHTGEVGAKKVESCASEAEVCKGTMIATLDFDDSDEDIFYEEAKGAKATRLSESTVDVNTGEKVNCCLEKGGYNWLVFCKKFCSFSSLFFIKKNFM